MSQPMIAMIFVAGLFFAGLIVVKLLNRQQKGTQTQALQTLLKLRALIAFTQKHRGMSAAFIQGDLSAGGELKQIKHTIQPIIETLQADPCISHQERWLGFTDHWGRFKNASQTLNLAESFEQHTNLVTNLLYLFEDIAEQQQFDQYTFPDTPNISLLWKTLPFTGEYIGQARAVGVAIVTKGHCSQVDKVRMGYLETKISQYVETLFTQLDANKAGAGCELKQAKSVCLDFLKLIRGDILDASLITISPKAYFNAASAAMNEINRLLDEELQHLTKHID